MPRKTLLLTVFVLLLTAMFRAPRAIADALEDDLAKLQGVWERNTGHDIPGLVRATKEIRGSHEVVTYYGENDKLLEAHEVDFEVQRYGGAKIFKYSNWIATEGPHKGDKSPRPVSYIYRADDNTYTEVWGFMPGQENRAPLVMMWVRRVPLTDAMRKELQALQGTWQAAKQDKGGPSATDVPGDEVTITGDDFISRRGGHAFLRGVIRLDPVEQLKRINVIITESLNGMSNGQTIQAVYEIDGSEVKWCSGPPAAPRPQALAATPASAQTVTLLRKVTPK